MFVCEYVADVGYRLKRKPDGSCVYLYAKGCSIWPNTPGVCRAFDCRVYARSAWASLDPQRDERVIAAGIEKGRAPKDAAKLDVRKRLPG